MVSFGPEPAALPRREIALLISGVEYKLNIWLQGVKETLPGLVDRQSSIMDVGLQILWFLLPLFC